MINMAIHNKGSKLICKCKDKKCFTSILSLFFVLSFFIISTPSHAFKINSSAIVKGGAIYAVNMDGDFYGQDEYSPLIFSNNKVSNSGGAIFFLSGFENFIPSSSMKVSFAGVVEVENNVASKNGGAMSFYTSTADALMEVNFKEESVLTATNNTASADGGVMYFYNGASSSGSTVTMNVNFDGTLIAMDNSASADGGVMYFYNDASSSVSTVTMNVNFSGTMVLTDNGKDSGGDAITRYGAALYFNLYWNSSMLDVNFANTSIITATNNAATFGGGVMYFGGNAGMTVNISGILKAVGNKVALNKSNCRGGVLYFGSVESISLSGDFDFENNYVSSEGTNYPSMGGDIYVGEASIYFGATQERNSDDEIIITPAILDIDSTSNLKEKADYGGSMYFIDSLKVIFQSTSDISIINSDVAYHGGGIYFYNLVVMDFMPNSELTIKDCYAKGYGGAIYTTGTAYISDRKLTVNGTIIIENNHASTGGGLSFASMSIVFGPKSVIRAIGNETYAENYGAGQGAAMYLSCNNLVFENGSNLYFKNNVANTDWSAYGGTIFANELDTVIIAGTVYFENNRQLDNYDAGKGFHFVFSAYQTLSIHNVIIESTAKITCVSQENLPVYVYSWYHANTVSSAEDHAVIARVFNMSSVKGKAITSEYNSGNGGTLGNAYVEYYTKRPSITKDEDANKYTVTPAGNYLWSHTPANPDPDANYHWSMERKEF